MHSLTKGQSALKHYNVQDELLLDIFLEFGSFGNLHSIIVDCSFITPGGRANYKLLLSKRRRND